MRTPATDRYKHHRRPVEIISPGVWRSFRFCLSSRDVGALLFARGVRLTYAAIRQWCRTFGQRSAHRLRRQRPRPGDTGHLDKVFLTVNGQRHDLWRAVVQDGTVIDLLVHRRRNQNAAKTFFRTRITGLNDVPRVIITDQLARDGAAKRAGLRSVEARQQR
jgi:putative transposase